MTDINTKQIFVPRSYDKCEKRTFKTAAAIGMGKAVELNSSGNVALATGQEEVIGVIDNMPDYRTKNSTGTVASGDYALVVLFGKTFKGESGGTFAPGMFLKFSSGKLVVTASFGTTVSDYVAVDEATAAGQIKEYLVK